MVGFMAKNPNDIVRYTSICRGVEAAGDAIPCKYVLHVNRYRIADIFIYQRE